jgi:hypothetical protein
MILKIDIESREFRQLADFLGNKAFPELHEGWEGLDRGSLGGLNSFARLISAREVDGIYRVVLEVDEVTDISKALPQGKYQATIPRDAILALFDAIGIYPSKQGIF